MVSKAVTVEERLRLVRARIERASWKSGRDPAGITLIAVSKGVHAAAAREAWSLGVTDFGENRVQEARLKIPEAGVNAHWHLIGHLQTNKIRPALPLFEMFHSLDRVDLALELQRQCERLDLNCHALVQVNIAGEDTKSGVSPPGLPELLGRLQTLDRISVEGLMTIAPYTDDAETVRPVFRELARLGREIEDRGYSRVRIKHLSMGMSGDFEVAIEEGATMVRVGTAIFGPRPKPLTV